MVNVGEVAWNAKVRGLDSANQKASQYTDTASDVADTMTDMNSSMEEGNQKAEEYTEQTEKVNTETERFDTKAGVLTGTLGFLFSTLGGGIAQFGGMAGAWRMLTGLGARLLVLLPSVSAVVATLSGWFSTAAGLVSGFVSWLAAGSAGAIAVAGAIGFAIGMLGVFVLEMTGVLDAVRGFAQYLGNQMTPAVRDAFLALISVVAGPLAVIGGAITGFVEGFLRGGLEEGFDQAIQNVMDILGIFEGAWERTLGRIQTVGENMMSGLGDILAGAWNAVIPGQITFPEFSIGGGSIGADIPHIGRVAADVPEVSFGGWSRSLPQLQSGGMIQQTGALVGHAGEMVVPADVTRNIQQVFSGGGGGGGGQTISIGTITIGDQSLDVRSLSRRELEEVVDELASLLGDEVAARVS